MVSGDVTALLVEAIRNGSLTYEAEVRCVSSITNQGHEFASIKVYTVKSLTDEGRMIAPFKAVMDKFSNTTENVRYLAAFLRYVALERGLISSWRPDQINASDKEMGRL